MMLRPIPVRRLAAAAAAAVAAATLLAVPGLAGAHTTRGPRFGRHVVGPAPGQPRDHGTADQAQVRVSAVLRLAGEATLAP